MLVPAGFELVRPLGRGGMGEVHLARLQATGEAVALKRIPPGALDPEALGRFARETDALARCSHPAIVRLVGWGSEGGAPWLAMEHLPGGSLEELVARGGPRPGSEVARLGAALASALAHAHAAGVLHRDVKPANVLLDGRGDPRLVDFGLARQVLGAGSLTATGALLGTPAYAAPEQLLSGRTVGPSADVYGLGATLYFLACGAAPFEAPSLLGLVEAVVSAPRAPLVRRRPGIDPDLAAAIERCLDRDPARRPALPALAETLARLAARPQRRARRASPSALAVGLLVLGGAAAAAVAVAARGVAPAPALQTSPSPAPPRSAVAPSARSLPLAERLAPVDALARQGKVFQALALVDGPLEHGPALVTRAGLRRQVGDRAGALSDLGAALARRDLSSADRRRAIDGLRDLGETRRALDVVEAALSQDQDQLELLLRRAELYSDLPDPVTAVGAARQACTRHPRSLEAQCLSARTSLDLGDAPTARSAAEAALALDPASVEARLALGIAAHIGRSERGLAEEVFESTRGKTPTARLRTLRARLARLLDRRDEAGHELRLALGEEPVSAGALQELRTLADGVEERTAPERARLEARMLQAMGAGETARAGLDAEALLAVQPDSGLALGALAVATDARGLFDQAAGMYRGALALGAPRSLELRLALSLCEVRRGDPLAAVRALADLPPPDSPALVQAWLQRGNAHLLAGDPAGAAAAAEQVLAHQPEDPQAIVARLLAWREGGEIPRALAEVDRLLAAFPSDSRLHVVRSQLLGQDDPQGSLAAAERAVELAAEPDEQGTALRQRAHARWRAGDQPGAWADVEALERLPRAEELARRVRAELETKR